MRASLRSWRSLGLVTASTGVSAVVTLVVTVVAVVLLEKAEYGHFVFFIAISTLVATFLDLGVTLQMLMEFGTGSEKERGSIVARHWSAQVWSYGGGALLTLALTIPVAGYFRVPDGIVALGALNGALLGLFNFAMAVLQAKQAWRGRARQLVQHAAFRGAATFIGLAFGSATLGALGAVLGAAVGLALASRDPVISSLRSSFGRLKGVADAWTTWMRSRWFTVLIAAAAIAQYIPIAWVGRVGGAGALASFGLAYQLAAGPALALLGLMTFLQPAGADPSVSLKDYAALAKRSVAPILALFVVSAVAAPFLIPLVLGREFGGAVAPFELLLIGMGVLTAASPLQILNLRVGDARGWALMDVVRVVTLIAGLIVLSPRLSVPVAAGAAFAVSALVSRVFGIASLAKARDQLRSPTAHPTAPADP